jgi:hypothetical protein
MGKQSLSWLPNTDPKNGMMWEVRFARKACTPCPHRAQCTRAKKEPRLWGLQAREQYEAPPASGRPPTPSRSSMRHGQASRAPTRRVSAGVASGKRAIEGSPEPLYNIWRRLQP